MVSYLVSYPDRCLPVPPPPKNQLHGNFRFISVAQSVLTSYLVGPFEKKVIPNQAWECNPLGCPKKIKETRTKAGGHITPSSVQFIYYFMLQCRILDSVIGIATRLLAGWSGIPIPAGAKDFYLPQNVHIGSRAFSVCYSWLSAVKRSCREVDH